MFTKAKVRRKVPMSKNKVSSVSAIADESKVEPNAAPVNAPAEVQVTNKPAEPAQPVAATIEKPAEANAQVVAQPIAHEIVTEGLNKAQGLNGEALRLAFESVFTQLASVAPWRYGETGKPAFAADKVTRKTQMVEFADRNKPFQGALKRLAVAAERAGFEISDKFSGGVTASGILVIRHSRTLKMHPSTSRRSSLSFGSGSWKVADTK